MVISLSCTIVCTIINLTLLWRPVLGRGSRKAVSSDFTGNSIESIQVSNFKEFLIFDIDVIRDKLVVDNVPFVNIVKANGDLKENIEYSF